MLTSWFRLVEGGLGERGGGREGGAAQKHIKPTVHQVWGGRGSGWVQATMPAFCLSVMDKNSPTDTCTMYECRAELHTGPRRHAWLAHIVLDHVREF